jgi:hypothetical protein
MYEMSCIVIQDGVAYSETRHPGPRGGQNQVNYTILACITVYITKRINFTFMTCDHYCNIVILMEAAMHC